jgi:TP901 family phage tail tape measure protein
VALRNTSAVLKEHNALLNASAISYKNAAGAGKTYLTVNRAMTASTVSLNQRLRYTATVLNAASTSLINFGKNVQWAGRQVMMGLTLPLMLIGTAASKAAEDLDRQLVRIVKVTNISTYKLANQFGELGASMRAAFDVGDASDEMVARVGMMGDLIRKEAVRLVEFGASLGFVAEETGKVSAEFAQMGFQGFALSALTKQATILSRVSGTDLNESVQLVRLTVQAFGNDIADLEEKFARLNLIENNTSLSLAEMAQGIPIVASVADNLGISIENLAGMLAVMKEKGIAAREGATALRTGLIQLIQKPTRNAVEAFKLINVNLDEMQERHRGDIIGFFNELAHTMDDVSGSGRQGQANLEMFTQALATLTGVRASARFLSLISEMGNLEKVFDEETGEEIWKVKEGLEENDVAARAFINTIYDSEKAIAIYRYELDQVNNSLSGIRDRLKAELNVELAKMGEAFLRVGNAVRAALNNVLRSFNSLSERTQNIIFSFGTFIAVLGPVTMFMGIFANALGQIAKGVTALLPKMKLMTAAQVAEARAQEVSNKGLALSLVMKEEAIATNMRLAASTNALATSQVLATHAMLGVAPLPMSIRPGASAAQAGSAAFGVLSKRDKDILTNWNKYQSDLAKMQKSGVHGPIVMPRAPSAKLAQKASASKVAGTAAAGAMLAPNLLKTLPGADLGYLSMPLVGGTSSVAQLLQQELEKDLLRTRNAAIASGAIGLGSKSGAPVYGKVLDQQFASYLKQTGYDSRARLSQIAMLAGQTGTLGQTAVDPGFFRYAAGMAPALAAGTVISGQTVGPAISKKTRIGTAGMADVIHNERLFQLAEAQRTRLPVAAMATSQAGLLRQQALALGLKGTAVDDFVRNNMPRTLPTPVAPVSPRQVRPATVRQAPAPIVPTIKPKPAAPAPTAAPAAAAAAPATSRRGRRSLLQIKSRTGGLSGREMRLQDSPLMRYTKSPIGRIGTGRAVTAAATGGAVAGKALLSAATRAEVVISEAFVRAGESVSRNISNAGRVAGASIANAVVPGYTKAMNAASRGRARVAETAALLGAGVATRGRQAISNARAAAFRGFEGITGQTGGLPQQVSRKRLDTSRMLSLGREFNQLEQMGQAPAGVTRKQYIASGMQKHRGIKGRLGEIRAASKGAQGMQATGFLRGVERGSKGAGYFNKMLMAAMVAPLKAPFQAVGKLGTLAGKGLGAVAAKGGILSKLATPLVGLGGKAAVAGGVALGAAMKLALPLTIVFGTLAMTNKDEFMSGLMSTLQGPLDRLRSAWDQLTQRFEYVMFLFRNLRGDGEGAFAGIARMVGRLAGWVGGILADAFTSVMTAIQVIFKAVEFLLKLFSGDFRGAITALKEAFQLFGIFVLELFLNIADTLVGWIPILRNVVRAGKDVVAGWREGITSLDDTQKALIEVDKTVRSLKGNSKEWQEGLDETEATVRRMSELEIFPMDLVDGLVESLSGWEFDPFGDFDEQVDLLSRTIAEMEEDLGQLPPQIQDLIMSYVEQLVVVDAINETLEEQERIKERLLGLTDNLTEQEVDELTALREQTSEMQAFADVLQSVMDGQGKSEGLWTRNWTDEMKAAAEELVEAGLLFKKEGNLVFSDEFYAQGDRQAERIRDYLEEFNRLSSRRVELEERTTAGMMDQLKQLDGQISAKEAHIDLVRTALESEMQGTESHAEAVALLAQLEIDLAELKTEHGSVDELLAQNRLSANALATNQIRFQEKQRHLEALRNAKTEAEARLVSATWGSDEYIHAHRAVSRISGQISTAESELNSLREQGVVLTEAQRDRMGSLLESIQNARREWSEAFATRRGMEDDKDPGEIGDNASSEVSSVASSFRSAMAEVMGDIASSFNRVLSDQAKRINEHFSNLKNSTKEYFSDYVNNLTEQTKEIMDQLEQRAQAEEDAINAVADLRVQHIEDQAKKERDLDELRERFFRREQARIDYVRSRATADIQIREALLRGERGRAAILRIEKELAAQQFYNDILKEREQDIREMREKAREQEIDSIEEERDAALKANKERVDIEKIAVSEAEKRAREAAEIAEQRAAAEIENAEKAAEEAMELEQYRIQQYLREWQKVTPATEEEFKKHLGELQKFFDQSNNRLRSEINKIYGDFSVVFNSMSKDFQKTNNSLMSELRTRLVAVEDQYLGMNNTILGAIHNTNVEVANSVDDILASIGESATTTEKILGDARDAFKISVGDMLDALTIASGDTLLEFTKNFIPEFTGNMDWAFATVNDMGKDFAKVFGHDLRAGFETAIDRAIAALTEEKKWKDAENQIAQYMANIARHLNINIPSPGGGGGGGGGSGSGSDGGTGTADPNAFPGNVSVGQRGEHVRKVQRAINKIIDRMPTFNIPKISEDGIFGPATERAVAAYINYRHSGKTSGPLAGIVDQRTWDAMRPYFHKGGLVGSSSMRDAEGALKNDEISAVLQRGEYVINRRAAATLGTDFLDRINSVQTKFSSPRGANGTLRSMSGGNASSTTNTYNLSFHVDGGNIDEQKLAQKVVFEIKKMERDMGMGRRVS